MSDIRHHIPDWMMRDYVAGALAHPFALVVATHVSMCDECRALMGTHEVLAGAALEDVDAAPLSADLRERLFARLDDAPPDHVRPAPRRQGIYPGPLAEAIGAPEPRWRSLGMGVRQSILHDGPDGSARLLFIPPGQAMPEHSHRGLEATLVLQGSFRDETDHFGVGDVEVADENLTHVPVAGPDEPCICLAATDAPLKFSGLIPRLAQPFLRI
ncbi:ChrR-like anti-ECFsigma factor [Albidovulum inexpectatum]|uniref:ChrR-like anti-ECFsigma factor n=1 Tax=Albidovulum inexpectatum TaxID=196587 RepID=A0A2S5JGX9_9RHOB|nr:ChrR family anti-sigma-E factor [Albidovulum inexpectatum]PPB80764.1 ChrR-like anti-ECFsigma factor [Albidovulum inexpectatum]